MSTVGVSERKAGGMEEVEKALDLAAQFCKRFGWADETNPEEHGEDCDIGDGDFARYQEHAADCEKAGQRIDLVKHPGTPWLVWPDIDCCDPEEKLDEDKLRAACDCWVFPLADLYVAVKAARAARVAALAELPGEEKA